MTVVLCGVGADTGNVRPVPTVDEAGRFEYVPIPEKGETAETATFGSLERRYGDGVLADGIDAVRPHSSGDWVTDDDAIASQPVHRDPNLSALTYGEHRPGYVAALRELEPGDVVAFYTGLENPTDAYKHRYCIGYFVVDDDPIVLDPGMDREAKQAVFDAHPENAHAKRYAAHGDCYYHDPAFTDRPRDVVVVPGREPGGVLDSAIELSDRRRGPNYYMREPVADALSAPASGSHGVHLGGIKPAVTCDVTAGDFQAFLDAHDPRTRGESD
jgi:hypothetical protein